MGDIAPVPTERESLSGFCRHIASLFLFIKKIFKDKFPSLILSNLSLSLPLKIFEKRLAVSMRIKDEIYGAYENSQAPLVIWRGVFPVYAPGLRLPFRGHG